MDLYKSTIEKLESRNVKIEEIAELVMFLQKAYIEDLTMEESIQTVKDVLSKREVQHAVLTGIFLDEATEKNLVPEPLYSVINKDAGLYGVDETLALAIVNVYGSIGLTNFGYIDRLKPGLINKVDELGKDSSVCNTFLDDLVGAIAAAAASKIAHTSEKK